MKHYTRKEIEKLFSTDEEGRYLYLVIPADKLDPEVSMIGRKRMELSIDEIARVKTYAYQLFKESQK